MDSSIKETLRAVGLNRILESELQDSFVNFAVTVWAKGKGNVGNGPQLPFLAIHLSCLANAVEFDYPFLQKKSTLNPKSYQSTLISLSRLINLVESEIVSKFYNSPTLKVLIDEIVGNIKEADRRDSIAVIASLFLIGQLSKMTKSFGTVGELAQLWGQPVEILKEMTGLLKQHCDAAKLKEVGKVLADEMKQKISIKNVTSVSPRLKRSLTTSPTKNQTAHSNQSNKMQRIQPHPLSLFNCSSKGPAFGPILFQ